MNELRDGRYVVLRTLGEGAQGSTFEAVDKRAGSLVAIKRFDVRGASTWKDVELAEREARVLESLQHPQLPAYVEHFEEEGALFLVMQKIEGETVAALRKRGAFSEAEVYRFLTDAAKITAYLRGRAPPVIHRDIKPSNVIRTTDGTYAFVDFGAVRVGLLPKGGSTVVGTFGYMAPEQFQGRALPATDIFAVGATAIAMLTGEEPEALPHQGLAIDVAKALSGHASPAMIEVLVRMVEPDPDRRAQDIAALLERFASAPPAAGRKRDRKREETPRAPPPAPPPHTADDDGLPFFLWPLALAFRVAIWAVLIVAIPLALNILSIFFGKGLRRAARDVQNAGHALRRAASRSHRAAPPARSKREDARIHVEQKVRIEDDSRRAGRPEENDEEEGEEEEEGKRKKRRRAR